MKLTEWHPGGIVPFHIGVYERWFPPGGILYSLWDGERWHYGRYNADMAADEWAVSKNQDLPWRGRTEP